MYLLDVRCLFAIHWRLNGAIKIYILFGDRAETTDTVDRDEMK